MSGDSCLSVPVLEQSTKNGIGSLGCRALGMGALSIGLWLFHHRGTSSVRSYSKFFSLTSQFSQKSLLQAYAFRRCCLYLGA